MPPIRRYLRITQHSVLECRIYTDNPADAQRWLLNERAPVLPRVIEAVRPLVLPKLKEENARAKAAKGGKKKKVVKNQVERDDFVVSIYLTETSVRHSVLKKERTVKSEKARLGTTTGRLTGMGTREEPVEVGERDEPALVRAESHKGKGVRLEDIPRAEDTVMDGSSRQERGESEEGLFLSEGSGDEALQPQQRPSRKGKEKQGSEQQGDADDKKKKGFDTMYDGFSIYGRILCLVVTRKETAKGKELAGGAGQAMMEDWIASTQMAEGQMMDE